MQTPSGIFGNKWATLVAGSALLLNAASAQPQYNAVDIGSLGGSSTAWLDYKPYRLFWGAAANSSTIANGINNNGQVVGVSVTTMLDVNYNPVYHAFLYSGGAMTDLGTLIGPTNNSAANAISDNGQVVGDSDAYRIDGTNVSVVGDVAFLYSGGTMTELSPPAVYGGTEPFSSSVNGININGQVVGGVRYGCEEYAFLYSGGTFSLFDGGGPNSWSSAYGINNNAQFVGQIWNTNVPPYTPDFLEAFLLSANSETPVFLGTLDAYPYLDASCAYAINNSGQVVGWSYLSDNVTVHAFVCTTNPGTMTDLGSLGGDISCAYGINTSGQIVGASYLSDNVTCHAFLCGTNSGPMLDLNNLVCTNSLGTYLIEAFGINDFGQIIANGANGHAYLLTPASQVTPPAPVFLSITQTGGTVSFTWSTVACRTYQVQYCSDLSSASWNSLGSASTATNGTMSAADSIGINPQRFYRVLMQ